MRSKKDAEVNTHARVILEEIHKYSEKHKDFVFYPGEITRTILKNIADCIIHNDVIPEGVTCIEMKTMAKVYLKQKDTLDIRDN